MYTKHNEHDVVI